MYYEPFLNFCDSEAANVLDQNREQFINDTDAGAIVMKLWYLKIIDEGDMISIKKDDNPTRQNEHLHWVLGKKCTVDSLKSVCDTMAEVSGNPKMNALGNSIQKSLDLGVCACTCMHSCVVFVCVHACVVIYN